MKGRPPKPTALKVLGGTNQPCRARKNEMRATELPDIPLAPEELNERGKQEWYIVCTELFGQSLLHAVDLALLAAYCNEVSIYWEAELLLRENGRVLTSWAKDGSLVIKQAPHVSIARNALKMAHQLAAQFGFTPAARTRITAPQPKDEGKDPFAQMMEDMKG